MSKTEHISFKPHGADPRYAYGKAHHTSMISAKEETKLNYRLTSPTTSMVLQGERTRKLRTLGPLDPLFPINHFKNGKRTPAMSRMDVKVFSSISEATCQSKERK